MKIIISFVYLLFILNISIVSLTTSKQKAQLQESVVIHIHK